MPHANREGADQSGHTLYVHSDQGLLCSSISNRGLVKDRFLMIIQGYFFSNSP